MFTKGLSKYSAPLGLFCDLRSLLQFWDIPSLPSSSRIFEYMHSRPLLWLKDFQPPKLADLRSCY